MYKLVRSSLSKVQFELGPGFYALGKREGDKESRRRRPNQSKNLCAREGPVIHRLSWLVHLSFKGFPSPLSYDPSGGGLPRVCPYIRCSVYQHEEHIKSLSLSNTLRRFQSVPFLSSLNFGPRRTGFRIITEEKKKIFW